MRKANALIIGIAVTLAAGLVAGFVLVGEQGDPNAKGLAAEAVAPAPTAPAAKPAQVEPSDEAPAGLEIRIDPQQGPTAPAVPGIRKADDLRPVGRVVDQEGEAADAVLGELIVTVETEAELAGFLARHDAELIDSFPGDPGEKVDHLVRIPLRDVEGEAVAAALVQAERGHDGEYTVSDPHLLGMLLVAATEKTDHGLAVSLNWVGAAAGIADGDVQEAEDRPNPFEWTYLQVGGALDTGVTGAWQLLDHHDKLDNKVRIMIADGGFFENADFPSERKIRLAKWNTANPSQCSGGNDCPWHGTDVALTAVGRVDNGFGTAGVAGPVGELVAAQTNSDFWTEMRRYKRIVDEERPAVVNMSFSWEVKLFRNASQDAADRHLGDMKDMGAIIFASAGNYGKNVDGRACVLGKCYENRLVIPCESKHAICVGGYGGSSPWLHENSNHGTAGGSRSVQMYAPFCVITLYNPINYDDTKWTCGTSFSAPFVAGAAALVKAADPGLSPDEIWDILADTAHVGGVHFDHYIPTEHQRRINVLDAVALALGVAQDGPQVTITSPASGHEASVTDWLDLEATAIDFKGQPLPVSWESSIDGALGTSLDPVTVWDLTAGNHTITARATDVNGVERSDTILLAVVDTPPEMAISWPAPDTIIYDTADLLLVGSSEDPDTYQTLPNGDVEWELVRNGQVVFGSAGHVVQVPGGTLQPGTYDVVFRGYQGSGVGEAETSLQVIGVPDGESVPTATITTSFDPTPYGAYNGKAKEFTLTGFGVDNEDGPLSGTRSRWIARADNGHEEVLCTGSSFSEIEPPADDDFDPGFVIALPPVNPTLPPVIGIVNNCASVDVELGLAPGAVGETVWTIVLEVSDSAGLVGRDFADITITYVTG